MWPLQEQGSVFTVRDVVPRERDGDSGGSKPGWWLGAGAMATGG
jgi:hypothetical protein